MSKSVCKPNHNKYERNWKSKTFEKPLNSTALKGLKSIVKEI